MKKPVTHDIPRLRRLLTEVELFAPFELFDKWRAEEGADIREMSDGTFHLRVAGVKVQTTSGKINALLMWVGKAREIIFYSDEPFCIHQVRLSELSSRGIAPEQWVEIVVALSNVRGAKFGRATIDEKYGVVLYEAWKERPSEQGEPRFMLSDVEPAR